MKTTLIRLLIALALSASLHQAEAQGTAFTYQGRLNSSGSPVNGSYDLTFALFSVSSGAGQVGNTVTNTATFVSNGLFMATLDFGANFPGADRWLEIGVRALGELLPLLLVAGRANGRGGVAGGVQIRAGNAG